MIDRFIYKCCDVLDRYSEWMSNLLLPKPRIKKMSRKTNTALIALLGTILMGLATWTLVTLIELQLIVTMIQSDLMSIDKQFGRVYNFIDSVRGKRMKKEKNIKFHPEVVKGECPTCSEDYYVSWSYT